MDNNQTFNTICHIGKLLLRHGGEVYRVEESIQRMGLAYGFKKVEVFAIPTFLTVCVTCQDDSMLHTTIRSHGNRINMDSLYELNKLIRQVCINPMDVKLLQQKVKDIEQIPLNMRLVFLGYGLTAGFFSVFFGGSTKELVFGTLIGFLIYCVIDLFEKLKVNTLVTTLASSIVLSFSTCSLQALSLLDHFDSITIGCLMVLVPGVAITNSLRDIIGGEYVSGLARMLEAILLATSIAIGVGSMLMLFGGL